MNVDFTMRIIIVKNMNLWITYFIYINEITTTIDEIAIKINEMTTIT